MYQIHNNCLTTDQGTVKFDLQIKEVIELGDVIVVRLIVAGGEEQTNNIYAVRNGKILWRIQDLAEFNPIIKEHDEWACRVYAGIAAYEKNPAQLIVTDWDGFRYLVDPANGKILEQVDWVR